jgi:acyl-homoserine lactone acylase PvdQ
MNRIPYLSIILIGFIFLGFAGCKPETEVEKWEKRAAKIEIFRDDFGVPHIYGKTDADAVFGLIYTQCEDDFPRIEQNYLVATGRLAEVEGESALWSDLRANLFMTEEEAIAYYENAPQWLKDLCIAWADGINYYLHTHPEVTPRLFTRFEPWMPMYFSEGSIGGDIESVSTRRIQSFYENRELTAELFDNKPARWMEDPQGSNGFAIAGQHTASGNAMLLINPHTTFFFRGEVHMVSEQGLNAYGAVTWGQFFIYQGFNDKNGWMHTSAQADVMDEFVQTIEETDEGLFYRYGDELRPVTVKEVSLNYKDGDEIKTRTFPIYRTHHGPITGKIEDRWVATAMMWEPAKALEQAFIRTKTANYAEFRNMMDYRTNSSNATVYADADGTIAYFHGNFIPRRDPQFDYRRPVDGSDPATDWQGLHEVDEIIQLKNPGTGWIQNCNSTPFTAAAEYSPRKEDFPYYMSYETENFRGIHAVRVLSQMKDLTLDGLIELAHDPYLPAFEKVIPGLVEAFDTSPRSSARLKPAIEVLRDWDFATSRESVAMTLANYYLTLYNQKGPRPAGLNAMERMDFFGTGTDYKERLSLFEETLDRLEADFGTWDIPWGEINRFQRLDASIERRFDDDAPGIAIPFASGNWGALASFSPRTNTNTKKIYGQHGNSFVAAVEFGPKVKAKSILAGGQSGDVNSPHFFDQAQMYADANWKEVAYYREDVEKRAVRKYKPGQ